jgi:hypothetical protein
MCMYRVTGSIYSFSLLLLLAYRPNVKGIQESKNFNFKKSPPPAFEKKKFIFDGKFWNLFMSKFDYHVKISMEIGNIRHFCHRFFYNTGKCNMMQNVPYLLAYTAYSQCPTL